MEITCTQMDVLISFYIEDDLSNTLKTKVEEHLKKCSTCRAKFSIIKGMLDDIKREVDYTKDKEETPQYKDFKDNLSAYIDNELNNNDNIKIKKYTINNKDARKELEDAYQIRRLMSESFDKSKLETKQDFSKHIIKKIHPDHEIEESYSIHPILKFAMGFILSVLILTTIVIITLLP